MCVPVPDSDEPLCAVDTDGDGVPDYLDPDDDGDDIPSVIEVGECVEGDDNCVCVPVPDSDEPLCAVDTDGDGTPDYLDPDDDGDGIPSEGEMGECEPGDDNCICYNVGEDDEYCAVDTDGDGIPNYLDSVEDVLSVAITGPTEGEVDVTYTFTATVSVSAITPTVPLPTATITYIWQIEGMDPVTQTGGITNTFEFVGSAADTYPITLTATNLNAASDNGDEASDSEEITLRSADAGGNLIYLPLVVRLP